MRRKKYVPEEEENLERWLLTYSDLITLLLALFVMMYAFSKIKEGNPNTLQVPDAETEQVKAEETTFLTEAQRDAEEKKFRKLRQKLEKRMKQLHYTPFVKITNEGRGLVIRMQDRTAFDLGSADLTAIAKSVLDQLAPIIKRDAPTNDVRVEGHTDNLAINTVAFPSNWHLSTSRAISVIFYMINRHHISAERFQAQGYGDRKPLVPNTTEASRKRNRRVDIVIVKRGGEVSMPNMRKPGAQPATPPAPEPAEKGGHH